jgi:hypothetical protein
VSRTSNTMPKRKAVEPPPLPKAFTVIIDGQQILPGQTLRITNADGDYVFQYVWLPDGSVVCCGGSKGRKAMRAFTLDRCHLPKVKRKRQRTVTDEQLEAMRQRAANARAAKRKRKQ